MDKSISAKNMTIEDLVKKINNKNVWINWITLLSPGIIFLADLIFKNTGLKNTSLFNLVIQIVILCFMFYTLFQLLDLHGLAIKKQQTENEPVDIPRSAISRYGRMIWNEARANIDYTKGITLLLENGFDTLSQKIFASLVALTTILAIVDGSIADCLSYFPITLIMYLISFWSLNQMKQNKEERKMSEYLLLTISALTNLLAISFYFLLVLVVYFSIMPTNIFFWSYLLVSLGLVAYFGWCYCDLIKAKKLSAEESSKKQENQ
jgi:membrane protein